MLESRHLRRDIPVDAIERDLHSRPQFDKQFAHVCLAVGRGAVGIYSQWFGNAHVSDTESVGHRQVVVNEVPQTPRHQIRAVALEALVYLLLRERLAAVHLASEIAKTLGL